MKPRRRIVLAVLACGLVAGLVLWLPGERGPVYQGKTLKQWMNIYCSPDNPTVYDLSPQRYRPLLPDSVYASRAPGIGTKEAAEMTRRRDEAADAVRHMGTNAIPMLLKWEDKDVHVAWKNHVFAALPEGLRGRHFVNWWLVGEDNYRISRALLGFSILGSNAIPAVPELTRRMMTRTSDSGSHAASALANMGAVGLPALLAAATNTQTPNRRWVVRVLGNVSMRVTNDLSGVLVLVQCLRDPNTGVATTAATGLSGLAHAPGLAVPALISGLTDTRGLVRLASANALRQFGPDARPAVPALLRCLNDQDAFVRQSASKALQQIAPEVPQTNPPPHAGP